MTHEVETIDGELKELKKENNVLKDRVKELETTVAYVEKEIQEFRYSSNKTVDYRM